MSCCHIDTGPFQVQVDESLETASQMNIVIELVPKRV
jgi:hypothetical protein